MKTISAFVAIVAAGVLLVGCSNEDDILKQREAAKKMPPPTAAQMAAGYARIQKTRDMATESDEEHAKRDPAWAAKVNEARKLTGAPLIGG